MTSLRNKPEIILRIIKEKGLNPSLDRNFIKKNSIIKNKIRNYLHDNEDSDKI